MANALYNFARGLFLGNASTDLDWINDNIKVTLVESTYTFSQSHDFFDDLGTNDNGNSANLGSKTSTDGIADAADTTITATAAVACNAIVIWKDTGTPSTSPLIAYIDTATGLPFTPAASQVIDVVWDNGANKIFKL